MLDGFWTGVMAMLFLAIIYLLMRARRSPFPQSLMGMVAYAMILAPIVAKVGDHDVRWAAGNAGGVLIAVLLLNKFFARRQVRLAQSDTTNQSDTE